MRLPWHQLDDLQRQTVKLGPNVRKLMIHWASRLMVPAGGGIHDAIGCLTNPSLLKAKMREALDKTMTALDAVKAAPDSTFGDDDESIAGEILKRIEHVKNSRPV